MAQQILPLEEQTTSPYNSAFDQEEINIIKYNQNISVIDISPRRIQVILPSW